MYTQDMSHHTFEITLTDLHGYTEVFTTEVNADDFDPENQTVGVLAMNGFEYLWRNTYVGTWLGEPDKLHEDCYVYMRLDGTWVADEFAGHVNADYMDEVWVDDRLLSEEQA